MNARAPELPVDPETQLAAQVWFEGYARAYGVMDHPGNSRRREEAR